MALREKTRARPTAALLAAFAAAACFSGIPAPGAAQSGRLVAAQSSDILSLDPSVDISPISLNIFKSIYDQLTDIVADGSVAPQLAKSWEVSRDAATWTFTLRTDATFHDGAPVSADDVVWSYRKIMADEKSPARTYLTKVKSVEKVAEDKVRFVLTAPFAPFDRQVSLISILPRKAYEEMGPQKFAQAPVGSGPYRLVRWARDDRLELEASGSYWGRAPKIKSVIFRPVPSESARTAALLSGELDVVPLLPPAVVERLGARKDVRIERVASNRIIYVGFNVEHPALKDTRARQAIDRAIDREAIASRLLRGFGKPAGQIVAPVTFGYDPAIKPTAYNPEDAKRLLKGAGYNGEPIPFQYPNNRFALGNEVAQAIAGYLGAAGLNVKMEGMEYAAFFPLWVQRKLSGLYMFAYGPSIMDAELPLTSLFETGPSRGYLSDPKIDELVRRQRAESDPAQRKALIGQIWRLAAESVPYAYIYNEVQAYGIRGGVKWSPRPDERLLFHHAELTR